MRTWIGYARPDRLLSYPDVRYLSRCSLPIRMCVGASSSPSIIGLRHDRSGCVSIPGAGPPTTAAARPTAHARAGPTPIRRFGVDDFEAHDPRQSRSDTSPPISQAVPGLQSGSDETHFVPPSSRETKPGTKRSLHGQNSPNSTLLGEQGEFCHGHAPKFLDRARSVRPQAVRSHVNPPAHTSTGYSIDGRAPHTGPARPGCGARGRWRGLAGLRDRSLRAEGSRVAISRAGRRPRAHKATRRLHEHITRPRPVSRPRPR